MGRAWKGPHWGKISLESDSGRLPIASKIQPFINLSGEEERGDGGVGVEGKCLGVIRAFPPKKAWYHKWQERREGRRHVLEEDQTKGGSIEYEQEIKAAYRERLHVQLQV